MNKESFDRNWLILGPLAVIFVIIYSWFSFTTSLPYYASAERLTPIFSWPDAMANNFFIDHFIEKSNFVFPEALNSVVNNIIHPRSTNVIANGSIVPTAFLGFVTIHGLIGKLIGVWLVKFLTALAAGGTVLFFYGLIKNLFNKNIALISAILLFTLASYWYYANLVMLPTIMFVFLVMAGFYFVIKNTDKNWLTLLGGLFLGLASIVRLTEIAWIFLTLAIIMAIFHKKISFEKVLLFVIGFIVPIALLLYYNNQTYDSPWLFGYFRMNDGLGVVDRFPAEIKAASAEGSAVLRYFKLIFSPFGFSAKHIVLNFYRYFVLFLWPYVALVSVGGLVWLYQVYKNKVEKAQVAYVVCSLVICAWLILYYGSWEFADKMVLRDNLIASSYVRYWLVMNIMILPFIALLFDKILQLKSLHKALNVILVAMLLSGLTMFSFDKVYLTQGEGLIDQKKIIKEAYELQKKVIDVVGMDSILINDRADKFFFPKIKVVDFNLDYSIFPELKKIISEQRIYYFSYRTEKDMDFINEKKLKSIGLKFILPQVVSSEYRLYKLDQINY